MFQNIHIYYQIYDSAVDYKVGNETFSKKEKKNGRKRETSRTDDENTKKGSTSFQQQYSNFNMTKYDFTKKRNMTTYYKLKQTSKTFSTKKKKKRANKKENNNPHAR